VYLGLESMKANNWKGNWHHLSWREETYGIDIICHDTRKHIHICVIFEKN